jgi:cytochrome b6-f complex iron-sulfur subunit
VTLGIVIAGVVLLAVVLVFTTARRRDASRAIDESTRDAPDAPDAPDEVVPTGREVELAARQDRLERRVVLPATTEGPKPPAVPLDDEAYGVTRRQFLNRGVVTLFTLGLASFGGAMLAFLWPTLTGGFGSKIRVGPLEDILAQIEDKKEPYYVAEGRFYINPFPQEAVTKARSITAYASVINGYENGIVALYQKCVHLGCRVPWCQTSQWFECPCHGSQYNRVGEKKGGPAPRGLDRFVVSVDAGIVSVDTSASGLIVGPPIGTNTTGQEAEGPHCV